NEATPVPRLDNALHDLLTRPSLTAEEQRQYALLKSEMSALLETHSACPGDGNLDGVVDAADIEGWTRFSRQNGGRSSWYDFNHDGLTDDVDLEVVQSNLGRNCRAAG